MSIENKEIGEIIKKCKILLLDIEGTTTSISFVKDKLFPYAEANVKQFLASQWETEDVKEVVAALRKLALEDKENKVDGVVDIPGEDAEKDAQIDGLVGSVKWQMALDRKTGPLKQLQGLIWKQGYDSGEIKGHVYDDVSPAIELWRSVDGQKVYIYSSGSVQAQKLLFGQSTAGDMLPMIDGHFDTTVGGKREKGSYTAIVEKIGCKPEEVLFLTDIVEEAAAAKAAGLNVAVVSRDSPAATEVASFPVITSFNQLAVSNKRKTDAQVEEPASKVAKTDEEVDPKTAAQKGSVATQSAVKETQETEKMEVEGVEVATEAKEEPMKVETIVEDITDTAETIDAPEIQVEPVIIEAKPDNKTEEKQTEKPEIEQTTKTDNAETKIETVVNGDKPAKEPSPETVITEIEEDVSDKLGDGPEVIDMVPVVEEPAAEMEDLQNVGEVLEKECDEILSKVQDVTNLDSIPVKPILNSIPEETMETENTDSNDIVDKILDTEIEMGMKQPTESETKDPVTKATEKPEEESKPVPDTNNTEGDNKKVPEAETKDKHAEGDKQSAIGTEEEKVTTNGTVEKKSEPAAEDKEKPGIAATDNPAEATPTEVIDEKATTETTPAASTEAVPESNASDTNTKVEAVTKNETETKVENETKVETETKEPHFNGKATNGDAVSVNGSAKVEELNDRLAENGSAHNGDKKVDGDDTSSVPEIKSKPLPTAATDTTESIQQATEA